jgi:hypothetical protein
MHKILVIRLCFSIYAVHVPDCIAAEDGPIQSGTCRAYIEKQSLITRILCILLVYIQTTFMLLKSIAVDKTRFF